jgi:hypothetical protein
MDIPTHYEQYSPEAMNSAAAEAGMMEKVIKQFEPDYRAIVPGGELRNVNPLANGAGMGQALPGSGPQPGHIEDGYRFKGGNPSDPNAWEHVGGSGSGQSHFP